MSDFVSPNTEYMQLFFRSDCLPACKVHMAITPTVPPKEKNRKSNNNRCIFQFSFSKITSSVDVVCCSIIFCHFL